MEQENQTTEKDLTIYNVETIARVCHYANKAYCETLDDHSHSDWGDLSPELKASYIKGVMAIVNDPDITPEEQHENWMQERKALGWVYGPVKDNEKKVSPCMVPYAALSFDHKLKDVLFRSIVDSFLTKGEEKKITITKRSTRLMIQSRGVSVFETIGILDFTKEQLLSQTINE